MQSDGEYVRVYQSVVDDPRFAGIFEDDHHFATWVRLLMIAEKAWPSSAILPRSARKASIRALEEAGIIELAAGDRYRIHGLDPERQRRSDHARTAAEARWSKAPGNAPSIPPGNAGSNAQVMLVRERVRERVLGEEESLSGGAPSTRAREGDDEPEREAMVWLSRHQAGIPEGGRFHLRVIGLVRRHGIEKVLKTWEGMGQATDRQYILGAENILDTLPNGRKAAEEEREAERQATSRRRVERTQAYLAELRGEVQGAAG